MATSFPFAQQFELNLSEQPTGDSDIIDDLTIIGSVHSANISDALTIIGDVSSSVSVTLDGVIDGNLHCTSLIVTPNGRVNGDIVANQEVTVQGKVTGTIRARHVMLRSSAKVEGDIFYHGIDIEMGACYDGRVCRTQEHVFNESDCATPGKQNNSEKSACKTTKNGDQPKEPLVQKSPTAGDESSSPPRVNGHVCNGHPDEMHQRQYKANGYRGEPGWRFSMYPEHDDGQKHHREDNLRQDSGSPGE